MTKDKIRVTIIGKGYGDKVIKQALKSHPNFQILNILSPRNLLSSKIENKKNSRNHSHLKEIIYSDHSDCIILAVPPRIQHYFMKHCLKAEKSFICEKPFNLNKLQAKEIDQSISKSNLKCAIGYQFRYDPLISAVEKINNELNFPTYDEILIDWNTAGSLNKNKKYSWRDSSKESLGVLSEWCSHVFDYVHYLTGSEFNELSCKFTKNVKQRVNNKGIFQAVDNSDQLEINSNLKSGTKCRININTASMANFHHKIKLKDGKNTVEICLRPPFSSQDLTITTNFNLNSSFSFPFSNKETRIESYRNLASDYFAYYKNYKFTPKLAKSEDALIVWDCIEKSLRYAKNN